MKKPTDLKKELSILKADLKMQRVMLKALLAEIMIVDAGVATLINLQPKSKSNKALALNEFHYDAILSRIQEKIFPKGVSMSLGSFLAETLSSEGRGDVSKN